MVNRMPVGQYRFCDLCEEQFVPDMCRDICDRCEMLNKEFIVG